MHRFARRRLVVMLLVVTSLGVSTISYATAHASAANSRDGRLTASRHNVLPGEVIILFAEGPGTRQWVGGAASYFEERMGGVWKDRYMLQWYPSAPPRVVPVASPVLDVGLSGPIQAVIPAVPPGTYRISRTYSTGAADTAPAPMVTLSTKVRVKRCPSGTSPTFVGADPADADPAQRIGQPGCTVR
jgi:hypothetical protein